MGEPATSAASPTVSDIIPIAHARVNGWAGWRTLEYHDPAEELAFVAKDFKGMLRYHVGVHCLQCFGPVVLLLPGFERATLLIQGGTVTIVLQMLLRLRLTRMEDQVKAKNIYTVAAYVSTAVQWAWIIYCDRAHGYAVISDTPLVLLLMCIQIILQGSSGGSVISYNLSCTLLVYPIFGSIVAAHLYIHEPPPGHQMLMRKREFFGVFFFIITILVAVSVINTHTRRVHLAELAGLAEHYQRQRDRLQYDLVYSGSSARAARRDGSERAPESDDGLLALVYEGVASTYGSNSELAFSELDEQSSNAAGLTETFSDRATRVLVASDMPVVPSEKAQQREAVLWSTLDSMGITPKEHAHLD